MVHFHLGTVQSIDLDACVVQTDTGNLDYDQLIIAVGGETNFFGIESVAKNSFGLKELEDATQIRNHLLAQFETAVTERDPVKRRALLTFVIVGAGPTGVECAGAISELVRTVLHKDYPSLNVDDVHVILMEATDRVMANMPEPLGEITANVLRKKHVDLQLEKAVSDYDGKEITLKDGQEIPTHTLIWAAGVRAASVLDTLRVEQDRLGRVKVEPTLQIAGHPEVFVIGDAANLNGSDGKPLPMIAPVAMQQASVATKNLLRMLENQPLEAFEYHDPGIMATIGRNQAVAYVWGMKLRGFIAWVMWLAVHIYQLIGFRNRLAVLLDWAWSYIFYERASRIIGPA